MSVLRMVLEPSPSSQSEEITNGILSGAIYGLAMLHHVGAPISQLIAPVTYVWRPFHLANAENGGDDHNSGGRTGLQSSESCSSHRQLWVWIHASSFSEGYDALKFACQKQMNENGILINFFSLEGQLAKLEVMGSKSFQLLQKILRPESCNPKVSGQLRKCAVEGADHDSEFNKYPVLENEDSMSSRAVLSFTVRDPRRIADVVPMAAPTVKIYEAEHEPGKDVTVFGGLANTKESVLPSCSEHEEDSSFFGKMTLWDASIRVTCPVEENVLCSERNHLRMDFICLDDQKSLILNSSTESQVSRSCPVMLFRNNSQMGSFMGWSLVVPISWVKVFWIAFISKGARAIGQREKQWIACEVGLPVFPTDFLDSNAYSFFMENARAAQDQKIERLPPAVRPLKVPVPPPWNSIRAAIQNGSVCRTEDIEYNLLPNSRSRNGDIPPLRVDGNPFDGIVARTSGVLADFLNEINGAQLFLFPPCPNGKPSIPELMKDESKHGALQHGVTQTTWDRKLCFVRVLLYAYKEGVFEEGAVICAPCLADISLWTSRSEKNEAGFQIPKSLVNSYFKEQSSGKWELQLPEDPAAIESYRLPLGFVTSGFVRGSKKPVAVGFCEAVILAGLREEQKGIPEKQRRNEIYVLVRNLRSSAYRLGLASIVLEQGEDLEFL